MKCLLCSSKFKDEKQSLDYYISYDNIDVKINIILIIFNQRIEVF